MKKCSRCKETKNGDEFGKRISSKDGLDSRCLNCIKECSKISADKNRIKNSNKIIFTNKFCSTCKIEKKSDCFGTNPGNKDGLRNECKSCRNIKTRLEYETNAEFRERESVRAAIIYLENRDYILNRCKQWSKDNPDKKIEQFHKRRARIYGQVTFDLPKDFVKILKNIQNNTCAYCSRNDVRLTVEHMLPLSRGGKHCIENVILACSNCNFSKHNKTLEEWLKHNEALQKAGITSPLLNIICNNLTLLISAEYSEKLGTVLISEDDFLKMVK